MSKKWSIVIFVVLAFVICVQMVIIFGLLISDGELPTLTSNSIVVIEVRDIIMDSKEILARVEQYEDRDDIKAIVFRMETPGGSVAASQELARAVKRLRSDKGKVVVTSVANLGASGGYYMACQSNAIVVNPGSLVGSIGVIMEHFDLHEMTDKLGIKVDAIASGAMKEAGTPFRSMRDDERALIKTVIDDAFSQFRGTVLEGRWKALAKATGADEKDSVRIEAALDAIADGRIMTGAQAVRAGLADELGDLKDAIELAGEYAGIEGEPNVIYDHPEEPWKGIEELFGLAGRMARRGPVSLIPPSGLWYLYR